LYRDITSGQYYQLPGPCLVRAFRHGQCIELREHTPEGSGQSRRWLAHPDGRIRSSRGSGPDFGLADLQGCLPQQLEASRQQLEEAALGGLGALPPEVLAAYPAEAGRSQCWREQPPPGPWKRMQLLELLRLLQDFTEIAIWNNLPQARQQIESAQEAGYDLWALLASGS
jgi:hypothetical protein